MGISAIFTLYPLVVILEFRIFANRTRDCPNKGKRAQNRRYLKTRIYIHTFLS